MVEFGASIFTRDKQGKNSLGYALEVNEKTIQDEQVFDLMLSGMLKEESEANVLKSSDRDRLLSGFPLESVLHSNCFSNQTKPFGLYCRD